jgi:hypothetical protein
MVIVGVASKSHVRSQSDAVAYCTVISVVHEREKYGYFIMQFDGLNG